MLFIDKKNPNLAVSAEIGRVKRDDAWTNADKTDSQQVRHCFNLLNKAIIKEQLLQEQHGLCAYCMRRIQNDHHMVIEHVVPIQQSGEEALSYSNMIGCCDGGRSIDVGSGNKRILCCDAEKGDRLLCISPFNETQMKKIRYDRNGRIYTFPVDDVMEHDINEVLKLNGLVDKNSDAIVADTATSLVLGRKNVYRNYEHYVKMLSGKNKLSRSVLEKKISEIENAATYIEYAGVWLYFLKRKLREMA